MRIIYLYTFCVAACPLGPLLIVYFEQISKSYAVASSIFSVAFLTQALLEIPTSILSDKFTRKFNLVVSQCFFSASMLSFAISGYFDSILLLYIGGFFWGVRWALSSGSVEAFIYETLKDNSKEKDFDLFYANIQKFKHMGAMFAIISSIVFSYFFSLTTLAFIAFVFSLSRVICSLFLTEAKSKPAVEDHSFIHFVKSAKELFANKKLEKFALCSILQYSINRSTDRFDVGYASLYLNNWLVASVKLCNQIFGLISCFIVAKVKHIAPIDRIFTSIMGTATVSFIALGLNCVASPFILAFRGIFDKVTDSAKVHILQQEYTDRQRATMDSIIALFSTIAASIMFSLAGFIADIYSLPIAIFFLVSLKVVVAFGYKRIANQYR